MHWIRRPSIFRRNKAEIKMHTLLDLHGGIPTFIRITGGKTHDVNALDEFIPEAGSFYVMGRGYIDAGVSTASRSVLHPS
jgi:hypothetical protein